MRPNTVWITGGSRGIGAACVRRFARAGMRVFFLWHSREDAAAAVARETGAVGLRCDLADAADTERVISGLLESEGAPDVLVNCAGTAHFGLFQDLDEAAWRAALSVNLDAAARVTRAVIPGMVSRGSGAILHVASMWGEVGASCEAAYSAAKAGLIGLTKALAKELGPSGIRVNCVSPGLIDTEMNARLSAEDLAALCAEIPLGRIGRPEEAAEAVFFLCGDGASFITGQVLGVSGGMVI
ncbi:MAG: 3-oxoacyl-ACP reductase FabG [Clostridia bacterium]|nr:3-oxoacyl-ACP reductase FabG [Clostridia bacterium]